MRFRLGIDLGGTKTEILALDAQGAERFRQRLPTPQGDYAAILRTIATLVATAEQTLGAAGSLGVGTPGSISRATGLLRGSNSVCMNGKPITRDLEQLLAREVRITNDANCFALSEASDGAGRGFDVVFGVILGTGVGGASSLVAGCSMDRMRSPANGATIRCRGRATTSVPAIRAFVGITAASRRFSAVLDSSAIMPAQQAKR